MKIQQFTNEAQEFWYNLISSDTVKGIIDIGTAVVDILGDITGALGEVGTLAVVVGGVLAFKKFSNGGLKTYLADLGQLTTALDKINNVSIAWFSDSQLLTPATLNGLTASISGLSKEQALLVLSTKNLSQAQTEQVLVNAGLMASNSSISASLLTRKLAESALSAEQQKQILTTLGLINAQTGEIISTKTCTQAAIEAALAKADIVGTDAAAIISSLGLTDSNVSQAVSWNALALSIWGAVKAIAAFLFTTPMGWFTLAIAGTLAVKSALDDTSKSYDQLIEKSEEAANSIKTISDDFKETEQTVSDISERFAELAQGVDLVNGKNFSLSDDEYKEFLDLSNQLADLFPTLSRRYDENGNAIVQLSGDADTMVGSLENLLDVQRQLANQRIADELPDLFAGVSATSNKYENQLKDLEARQKAYNMSVQSTLIGAENSIDAIKSGGMIQLVFDSNASQDELNKIKNQYISLFNDLGLSFDELSAQYKGNFGEGKDAYVFQMDYFGLDKDELAEVQAKLAEGIQNIASTYNTEIDNLNNEIMTTTNENKANWNSVLSSISSWLATDSSYQVLSDDLQSMISSMMSSMDFSQIVQPGWVWEDFEKYLTDSILNPIKNATNKDELSEAWSELLQINVSKISVDEATSIIDENIAVLSKALGKSEDELKIQFGFTAYDDVDALKKDIKDALPEISDEYLGALTLTDLKAASYVSDQAVKALEQNTQETQERILERQMDMYKYLGANAAQSAQDILKNFNIVVTPSMDFAMSTESVGLLGNPGKVFAASMQKILGDNGKTAIDTHFRDTIDSYIQDANELQVILGKLADKSYDDSDLARLQELGLDTSNIDNLDNSVRALLRDMNSDIMEDFSDQFGKVKTSGDRRELEALRAEVLKAGDVIGHTQFSINIATETAGYQSLATALQESLSATGLSSESISNLRSRYAELEAQGYDLDAMFEETTNGIHLNRQELNKLEDAYELKYTEQARDKVEELRDRYDLLTQQIEDCTNPSLLQGFYAQKDALTAEMRAVAQTAAQYEGLTSAYNKWQMEQEAGNERDMYEGVITGFEEVEDELSRGWFDDDTVAFLELLTGKNISAMPVKEQLAAYKELGEAINVAGKSVKDFFTVDSDGNATSKGVYNFLDTINASDKLGDAVTVDTDGNYSFDFGLLAEYDEATGRLIKTGDQVIAETLGISEELVQILLRAADDAGFTINLEGAFTQLADLKDSATEAANALKLLQSTEEGNEKLAGLDLNFDFDATGQALDEERKKAEDLLSKFKVDGKVDFDIEGAKEAAEIAWYYQSVYERLNQPAYMSIETTDVEAGLREPLAKLQRFEELTQEEYRFELIGDTEGLEGTKEEMESILDWIESNEEFKMQANLVGLNRDEIEKQLRDGTIEFPATATINFEAEMNGNLEKLVALMMNEKGLLTDEELTLVLDCGIDTSKIDNYQPEDKTAIVNYTEEHSEVTDYDPDTKHGMVEYITHVDDETLQKFDKEYTAEQKELRFKLIAESGNFDATFEELDKMVAEKHFVEVGVDDSEVTGMINMWEQVKLDPLIARLSAEDQATFVVQQWNELSVEDKQAYINGTITVTDDTAAATDSATENVESIPLEHDTQITATDNGAKSTISSINTEMDYLRTHNTAQLFITKFVNTVERGASVEGTAHVRGTAISHWNSIGAYAKGTDWRLQQNEEALVNEVGTESIVRNGRWFPIPGGAHVEKLQKGDIIFNAAQTEELIRTGKVISGGGHGKIAYANGTAFGGMSAYNLTNGGSNGSGLNWSTVVSGGVSKTSSSGKGNSSSSNSSDAAEEFKEILDWIERKIKDIERDIDNLDQTASATYKSWSKRNSALTDEIALVNKEIGIQQQAYERYMKEANSVGLDEKYAKLVREGAIDIETITDEKLNEQIQDYQNWYDKAIDCQDAVQDLQDNLAELAKQRFDNVVTQFEDLLSVIEHTLELTENAVDKIEAEGYFVSVSMYKNIKNQQEQQLATLQDELASLQSSLTTAMAEGNIEKYSEDWYELVGHIQDVESEISSLNNDLVETNNLIRETPWNIFDKGQEMISRVSDEADWLIDLMSNEKMFDEETAAITEHGQATLGLHAVNYNAYLSQVNDYAKELEKINEELAKDPNNQILIDRKHELEDAQKDVAASAKDEQQALKDLASEGYDTFLSVMDKAIDKRKEMLSITEDLYNYERQISESTAEIAKLEKQLQSYQGDTSESAKATVQQLKVSLEDAKQNLEDMEREQWISDQEKLLDSLRD